MTQYFKLAENGEILGVCEVESPDDLEHIPETTVENPNPLVAGWPEPPTPTSVWHWVDGAPVWVETASLQAVIAQALVEVDRHGDSARIKVVGDAARIKEYEVAEVAAKAYKESSWSIIPVPDAVQSWADAKGWTARQSAEDIISASNRWYGALLGIRRMRLKVKEDIRGATTPEQVVQLLSSFNNTLTQAMQGVQ